MADAVGEIDGVGFLVGNHGGNSLIADAIGIEPDLGLPFEPSSGGVQRERFQQGVGNILFSQDALGFQRGCPLDMDQDAFRGGFVRIYAEQLAFSLLEEQDGTFFFVERMQFEDIGGKILFEVVSWRNLLRRLNPIFDREDRPRNLSGLHAATRIAKSEYGLMGTDDDIPATLFGDGSILPEGLFQQVLEYLFLVIQNNISLHDLK